MGQVHHPPLFSDEWLEFHAELVARFKRYSLSFGIALQRCLQSQR